jgi:DNA-binding MarR family transcriptional regulator
MADAFDIYDHLSDTLFRAHRARFTRLLHRCGLSLTQAQALRVLHEERGATMSHLAERVGLSPGALTSTIERMVELGWVDRRRVEGDRRSVRVELTDAGRERIAALLDAKRALSAGLFNLLTPENQQILNAAMLALREAGDRFDATDA